MTAAIGVRSGAVYISAEMARRYFGGIDAVVVLIGDGMLRVLPVRQMESGGCLLKIRNAAGDRVASAPDVFRAHGLGDWAAADLPARWSSEQGALVAELPHT